MFKVQAIFWYNSQHHMTRRDDLATAQNSFCRFLENHTPREPKPKLKISDFECVYDEVFNFPIA